MAVGATLAILLLAGCAGPSDPVSGDSLMLERSAPRPVVVAVVDSGSSPYLPIFASAPLELPARAETVRFTRGATIEESLEADSTLWASLTPRQLYWYETTRLMGISFYDEGPLSGWYTIDYARHGSKTTYLVAREAPDAIIVNVQVNGYPCEDRIECGFQPSLVDALDWVSAQDWIDIVSISMGNPGNPPDTPLADETAERFVAATKNAVDSGKIVLVASGNLAIPSLVAPSAGPPWIITVGGIQPNATGMSAYSSQGIDIVGNFTEYVPTEIGVYEWSHGTSIATPIVAGTLARAVDIIRSNGGIADPAAIRAALNATGIHYAPTDWDPTWATREPEIYDIGNTANLPVLLQPQMGWGYVDGSFAEEIARRVLENDLAPPPEKQQAIAFQAQWQSAREEYWSRYG